MAYSPGTVRDAIVAFMKQEKRPVHVKEIYAAVDAAVGSEVPRSSIRSYLNFNVPEKFERTGRGQYRLRGR
jgi:hypothetical protein